MNWSIRIIQLAPISPEGPDTNLIEWKWKDNDTFSVFLFLCFILILFDKIFAHSLLKIMNKGKVTVSDLRSRLRSNSYLEAFSESAFLASLSICCVDQIAIITSQSTNIFCFCQNWTSEESFAAFTRLNFAGFSFCVGVNIARARNKLRLIFDRISKNTWKRAWIMMSIWFSSADSTRSTCPLKDIFIALRLCLD